MPSRDAVEQRYERAVLISNAAAQAPDGRHLTESAIAWLGFVSDDASWNHPDLALSAQVQLGHAFRDRWRGLGDPADLDRAVGAYEATLTAGSETLPYYHTLLADLAQTLLWRYDLTGDVESLDAAVAAYGAALQQEGAAVDWLEAVGANWGLSLYKRYGARHDLSDLEAAIHLFESLLDSHNAEARANAASNLGIALRARYVALGDGRDLDGSIVAQQRAISLLPSGSRPLCQRPARRSPSRNQ